MPEEKTIGSTRRFGARYGRKVKYRLGVIETEQRKLHKCPYCSAVKVKRIAAGIWGCRKCNAKFTGKAYSVRKKITFREGAEEGPAGAEKEAKEEAKEEPGKEKEVE